MEVKGQKVEGWARRRIYAPNSAVPVRTGTRKHGREVLTGWPIGAHGKRELRGFGEDAGIWGQVKSATRKTDTWGTMLSFFLVISAAIAT